MSLLLSGFLSGFLCTNTRQAFPTGRFFRGSLLCWLCGFLLSTRLCCFRWLFLTCAHSCSFPLFPRCFYAAYPALFRNLSRRFGIWVKVFLLPGTAVLLGYITLILLELKLVQMAAAYLVLKDIFSWILWHHPIPFYSMSLLDTAKFAFVYCSFSETFSVFFESRLSSVGRASDS